MSSDIALVEGHDIVRICSESSIEVGRMLDHMPDISVGDLAKAVSVSVMVMQQEAYHILAEARSVDGARRLKRAYVAGEMLAKAGALASVAGSLHRVADRGPKVRVVADGDGLKLVSSG